MGECKQGSERKPTPLACLPCRQKHQQCDGQMPVCGRCSSLRSRCEYTPSRRGHRAPHDSKLLDYRVYSGPSSPADGSAALVVGLADGQGTTSRASKGSEIDLALLDELDFEFDLDVLIGPEFDRDGSPQADVPSSSDRQLIDSYFCYFHPAHPILPPARVLYKSSPLPLHLDLTIRFIGSHFIPRVSSAQLRRATMASLKNEEHPTHSKVQALLLLSIILHARNEQTEAVRMIGDAVRMAVGLGMNRATFAASKANHNPIVEESLRRTWWELYINDTLLAAFLQRTPFITTEMVDVPLPCSEAAFSQASSIPTPRTLSDYVNHPFDDEDDEDDESSLPFSSFAHRISATLLLHRTISLSNNHQQPIPSQIQSLDTSIASWHLHAPSPQPSPHRPSCKPDELLLQAHTIINCASIYLHFPRSSLTFSSATSIPLPCTQAATNLAFPIEHAHVHAAKALQASDRISRLAALAMDPSPPHHPSHSSFLICGLVLDVVVQLAACCSSASAGGLVMGERSLRNKREQMNPSPRKETIKLVIGVLKVMAQTWELGRCAVEQVREVAREILLDGRGEGNGWDRLEGDKEERRAS